MGQNVKKSENRSFLTIFTEKIIVHDAVAPERCRFQAQTWTFKILGLLNIPLTNYCRTWRIFMQVCLLFLVVYCGSALDFNTRSRAFIASKIRNKFTRFSTNYVWASFSRIFNGPAIGSTMFFQSSFFVLFRVVTLVFL
jgi:hypothetical protein